MSDKINLLRRVENLEVSPQFDGVSKLVCNIDDETQMSSGTDSGYVLEFDNPLITKTILDSMMSKIRGFHYQPFNATQALLDPAAEMGDAVSVKDVYGGIYNRSRNFSSLMTADISAPTDEEIDHEYKFETKQEKKVKHQIDGIRATLTVQAGLIEGVVSTVNGYETRFAQTDTKIEARVTKTGGNNVRNSFSWELTDSGHKWYANGNSTPVMSITKNGLVVNGSGEFSGTIRATSGEIGGFTIANEGISTQGLDWWNETIERGIYFGTRGIRLGQNFWVNTSGKLYAKNLEIQGDSIKIGGTTITASDLQSGAQASADNSDTWSYTSNTVSSNSNTWTTGASNGNSAKKTWDDAQDVNVGVDIVATYFNLRSGYFIYHGATVETDWSDEMNGYVFVMRGEG